MRTLGLFAIAMMGLGLSGCSQISSVFKKKPHYHTDDGTAVYTGANAAALRTTPQQAYQFAQDRYDLNVYDASSQYAYAGAKRATSPFTGYGVELYNAQPAYTPAAYTDPRDVEFVMLNGESKLADWQTCESQHRGYLFASEYSFSLNPEFEVCMRNKGYVLTTEYRSGSKEVLNAQKARLRGPVQFSSTVSAYPGYF